MKNVLDQYPDRDIICIDKYLTETGKWKVKEYMTFPQDHPGDTFKTLQEAKENTTNPVITTRYIKPADTEEELKAVTDTLKVFRKTVYKATELLLKKGYNQKQVESFISEVIKE